MTIEMTVDILRNMLYTAIVVVSPVLGSAIVIGVSVSLLQSITSIQEQTLTFVPKLLGVGFLLMASSHWMIRTVVEFCVLYFQKISDMGP